MAEVQNVSSRPKGKRGARYVIEYRTKSTRTKSGWTKWQHYIVAERLEDAERSVANLDWWRRDNEGETRIVDRWAE